MTIFRYDDRRKKDGEQEAVALHKWDELTSFYATLRERHSQLPDLPELDELTFVSGAAPCPCPWDCLRPACVALARHPT